MMELLVMALNTRADSGGANMSQGGRSEGTSLPYDPFPFISTTGTSSSSNSADGQSPYFPSKFGNGDADQMGGSTF